MKNVLRLVTGISLFVATAASASMPARDVWKNATFDQYKREVLDLWEPVIPAEAERTVETLTPLLKADAGDKGTLLTWLDRTLRGIEERTEVYGNDTDDYRAFHAFFEGMLSFFQEYSESMKGLFPGLMLNRDADDLFSKCFMGIIEVYKAVYGESHAFVVELQKTIIRGMGVINGLLSAGQQRGPRPSFGRQRGQAPRDGASHFGTGPSEAPQIHVHVKELHGEHVHMYDPSVQSAFGHNVYHGSATATATEGVRQRRSTALAITDGEAADAVSMEHDHAVVEVNKDGKVRRFVVASLRELMWLAGSCLTSGGLLTASYCNSGIPLAQAAGSGLLLSPGGMLLTFGGGIAIYATSSLARKIISACRKKEKMD